MAENSALPTSPEQSSGDALVTHLESIKTASTDPGRVDAIISEIQTALATHDGVELNTVIQSILESHAEFLSGEANVENLVNIRSAIDTATTADGDSQEPVNTPQPRTKPDINDVPNPDVVQHTVTSTDLTPADIIHQQGHYAKFEAKFFDSPPGLESVNFAKGLFGKELVASDIDLDFVKAKAEGFQKFNAAQDFLVQEQSSRSSSSANANSNAQKINEVNGTAGNDTLTGGSGVDHINGLSGDDSLSGLNGNDELRGGDDADTLLGGNGQDLLIGGAGNDTLNGGDGADTMQGGTGNDRLYYDATDTSIDGEGGFDILDFSLVSQSIDLGDLSNVASVETLELGLGAGNVNDLTLSYNDILSLSDSDDFIIIGQTGSNVDSVTVSDGTWTFSGVDSSTGIDLNTYSFGSAALFIEVGLDVTITTV